MPMENISAIVNSFSTIKNFAKTAKKVNKTLVYISVTLKRTAAITIYVKSKTLQSRM